MTSVNICSYPNDKFSDEIPATPTKRESSCVDMTGTGKWFAFILKISSRCRRLPRYYLDLNRKILRINSDPWQRKLFQNDEIVHPIIFSRIRLKSSQKSPCSQICLFLEVVTDFINRVRLTKKCSQSQGQGFESEVLIGKKGVFQSKGVRTYSLFYLIQIRFFLSVLNINCNWLAPVYWKSYPWNSYSPSQLNTDFFLIRLIKSLSIFHNSNLIAKK